MGPPGGGRNPVSARVLRHFNILSFTELSDDSVGRIFTTILGAYLQRNFGEDIGTLKDKVRLQLLHGHALDSMLLVPCASCCDRLRVTRQRAATFPPII
jgi:hypothetical protein